MANRRVWQTASSEATYLRGSVDDHNDSFSGGRADHDDSDFVDVVAETQGTYLYGAIDDHNDSSSGGPATHYDSDFADDVAETQVTYLYGTADDHGDPSLGGTADHDNSDFVDDFADTQERQGQHWHDTTNAIIRNGSSPARDVPSGYRGILYGAEDTTSSPTPGFTAQAHVYPNGYDRSMDFGDGTHLLSNGLSNGQLNHMALRQVHYAVPETDDEDENMAAASPPSTTDTVLNNHGSPNSSAAQSDHSGHSADDNREDRRLARHARRRSTEQYAGGHDRPSRRAQQQHRGRQQQQRRLHPVRSNGRETGQRETGNLATAAGFGLPSAAWPEVYWRPALAVVPVQGPGISLSGYPTHLVEEDLVDYPVESEAAGDHGL